MIEKLDYGNEACIKVPEVIAIADKVNEIIEAIESIEDKLPALSMTDLNAEKGERCKDCEVIKELGAGECENVCKPSVIGERITK